MKTVLVLASHPELAEAVRAALNAEEYRIVHRADTDEAEPFLQHGAVDVCVVDVESSNVQGLWMIEKLHRRLPACPIIAFTGATPWEWEEEAYIHGVSHFLVKPVRPRVLQTLTDRFWKAPPPATAKIAPPRRPTPAEGRTTESNRAPFRDL